MDTVRSADGGAVVGKEVSVSWRVDHARLVSSADIRLHRPVARRESGMPIGTGRMGSLVWTTPDAMHFQINHTDVYASDCYSQSFFQRDSDYGFGLGFVDIRVVDYGPVSILQRRN